MGSRIHWFTSKRMLLRSNADLSPNPDGDSRPTLEVPSTCYIWEPRTMIGGNAASGTGCGKRYDWASGRCSTVRCGGAMQCSAGDPLEWRFDCRAREATGFVEPARTIRQGLSPNAVTTLMPFSPSPSPTTASSNASDSVNFDHQLTASMWCRE